MASSVRPPLPQSAVVKSDSNFDTKSASKIPSEGTPERFIFDMKKLGAKNPPLLLDLLKVNGHASSQTYKDVAEGARVLIETESCSPDILFHILNDRDAKDLVSMRKALSKHEMAVSLTTAYFVFAGQSDDPMLKALQQGVAKSPMPLTDQKPSTTPPEPTVTQTFDGTAEAVKKLTETGCEEGVAAREAEYLLKMSKGKFDQVIDAIKHAKSKGYDATFIVKLMGLRGTIDKDGIISDASDAILRGTII